MKVILFCDVPYRTLDTGSYNRTGIYCGTLTVLNHPLLRNWDVNPRSWLLCKRETRIPDPGWIKWGSGIREKHPGSATMQENFSFFNASFRLLFLYNLFDFYIFCGLQEKKRVFWKLNVFICDSCTWKLCKQWSGLNILIFVVFLVVISRGACIVYKDRKALKFERPRLLSGKSSCIHRKISVIRAENYTSETGSVEHTLITLVYGRSLPIYRNVNLPETSAIIGNACTNSGIWRFTEM